MPALEAHSTDGNVTAKVRQMTFVAEIEKGALRNGDLRTKERSGEDPGPSGESSPIGTWQDIDRIWVIPRVSSDGQLATIDTF
jgi:hypothetical protein